MAGPVAKRETIETDAPVLLPGPARAHEHTAVCRECGEVLDDVVLIGLDGKPTPRGWRKIGEQLSKPMPTWQAKKPGGTFPYLKPRQIADRLDAVVGPGNWSDTYRVVSVEPKFAAECQLAIFGVVKCDVGYSNNPDAEEGDREYETEPGKAAYTDAFKRAATRWGIGRWLQKGAPG